MTVVKHDAISITLTIIAVAIFIYSATFTSEMMLRSTFIVVMALSGPVLSTITKQASLDENISVMEGRQMLMWAAISFGSILFLNLSVKAFPFAITGEPVTNRSTAILIAVAEENFFRGFISPYLASKVGIMLGSVMGGVVFAVYHLAVYNSIGILFVVLGAGIILSYAAMRTGRVSTTMLPHVVNNFVAVG